MVSVNGFAKLMKMRITRNVASVSVATLRLDDGASAMCRPLKVFASYSCWPSFANLDNRKSLIGHDSVQLVPPVIAKENIEFQAIQTWFRSYQNLTA